MMWSLSSAWRLISLRRGYYHILLTSAKDKDKVWARGSLHLRSGVLRLQQWSFGFDPLQEKTMSFDPLQEKTMHAKIWVRLWEPSILDNLARQICTALKFDKNTLKGDFGHYARFLVDINLAKPIKQSIMLECECTIFETKAILERAPAFCKACNTIGHVSAECRTLRKEKGKEMARNEDQEQVNRSENDKQAEGIVGLEPMSSNEGDEATDGNKAEATVRGLEHDENLSMDAEKTSKADRARIKQPNIEVVIPEVVAPDLDKTEASSVRVEQGETGPMGKSTQKSEAWANMVEEEDGEWTPVSKKEKG